MNNVFLRLSTSEIKPGDKMALIAYRNCPECDRQISIPVDGEWHKCLCGTEVRMVINV